MKKVSYKKLFKLMIDLETTKKEVSDMAGISTSTITKMSKGECVNMDMLVKICTALDCDLHDIVEIIDSTDNEGRVKKLSKQSED